MNDKGAQLQQLMNNYSLPNYINEPTRIANYKSKETGLIRTTKTLIDVILHNGDLIHKTAVIGCPYSDHKFILASINLKTMSSNTFSMLCRNTSGKNMLLIITAINNIDFNFIQELPDVNSKLSAFSNVLLDVINLVAPLRSIKIKDREDQTPWVDLELLVLKNKRDIYYKLWTEAFNRSEGTFEEIALNECFKQHKADYQKMYRNKLTQFLQTKTMSDFKSIKDYWKFHSSHISLKSDKSSSTAHK